MAQHSRSIREANGRLDQKKVDDLALLAHSLEHERAQVRRKDRAPYTRAIEKVNDAIEEKNRFEAGTKFAGLRKLKQQAA